MPALRNEANAGGSAGSGTGCRPEVRRYGGAELKAGGTKGQGLVALATVRNAVCQFKGSNLIGSGLSEECLRARELLALVQFLLGHLECLHQRFLSSMCRAGLCLGQDQISVNLLLDRN